MLYSYLLKGDDASLKEAQKELQTSLDKSYELYNYLLLLIVAITDAEDRRLDDARNKYLPTEEDLHPNTRFIDNKLVATLRADNALTKYVNDNKLTWANNQVIIKMLLMQIKESEDYQAYMAKSETSFAEDCALWKALLKQVILPDANLAEVLENKSLYWNDDIDIMGTFVIKTIRRFEEAQANATADAEATEPVLPKYKDEEDSLFGEQLFSKAVQMLQDNDKTIGAFINQKWDADRVAFMDRVIMDVCITEILSFDQIPTSVSLNEYIEIAKYYSTPKSSVFVNGILNAVVKDFKAKRIIVKD